ncbi:MAG: hypothetical protein GVY28_01570, partial [Alphaproteobacteria bacterium]|nr:hypothetical protein [Alphaproteobacteria bacterium]
GALLGQPAEDRFAGERALAAFLTDGRETMIDDALGHPVIVARRSARDLVLPASDAFKLAITLNNPVAEQIAVPEPGRTGAARDQILQNFPFLYTEGLPEYRLVYDRLGWRVWRRGDL